MLNSINQETIGQRIARLRKERGITQKEFAELLGIAQSVISDYERGKLRLHSELIINVAKILGVSVNEILDSEDNKKKPDNLVVNRKIYKRLKAIDKLPKRDQEALFRTIDTFLLKTT